MTKLADYLDWIAASALPVWATRGFDVARGRFHERLDAACSPLAVPHRAMVQARQIFVFAHAARQGWSRDGAALAETATAALLRDFAVEDGDQTHFAFAIDPISGAVTDNRRDAYAHAFVLFALAALHRLNGDPKLLETADRVIRFVEHRLTDPSHGGLFDALPPPAEKRQNPHMHLLEAYLFLAQTAPGRGYEERAVALVALARRHFLRDGVLLEYFAPDWAAVRPTWEPGHHFEWVWLLAEFGELTGTRLPAEMDLLYQSAAKRGVAADGLLIDELAPDGRILKPSHRVWPHSEAIKAAAVRGDQIFAEAMAANLMRHFLGRPFAGGWVDHVAPDGAPLVDHVPASTLYHLVLAASVAAKHFAAAPPLAKAVP